MSVTSKTKKTTVFAIVLMMLAGIITAGLCQRTYAAGETVEASIEGYNNGDPIMTYEVGSDAWTALGEPVLDNPMMALYAGPKKDAAFASYFDEKTDAGKTLVWYLKDTDTEFKWYETTVSQSREVVGKWEDTICSVILSYGDGKEKIVKVPHGDTFASAGDLPSDTDAARKGYELTGWVDAETGEAFDVDEPVTTSMSVVAQYNLVASAEAKLVDIEKDYPASFSGTCTVGGARGAHQFTVTGLDNVLAGYSCIGHCQLPGAGGPVGSGVPYTATRQSIVYGNDGSATITYALDIRKSPTGKTNAAGDFIWGSGYQNLLGHVSLKVNVGGMIEIEKVSANPEISNSNPSCYSLDGVKFGVYSDKNLTKLADTITMAKSGTTYKGSSQLLPIGTYYVQELKDHIGKSYAWNENVYTVQVAGGQTTKKTIENEPQDDPIDVLAYKVDMETLDEEIKGRDPQGGGTLEGAQFTYTYYGVDYNQNWKSEAELQEAVKNTGGETRTWVFQTDPDGFCAFSTEEYDAGRSYFVSGDEFYYAERGGKKEMTMPIGVVVVKETKAPEGYHLNDEVHIIPIPPEGVSTIVDTYQIPIVSDDAKRGDFSFKKVADNTLDRMGNIPFKVTSKSTGEWVIIMTDENGEYHSASSWSKHTNNTNANNDAYNEKTGKVDVDALDVEAGIWFKDKDEDMSAIDDKKGALLYDTYTLEELRCEANKGYGLINIEFKIYRDNGEEPINVDLGTLTDDELWIKTKATTEDDAKVTYGTKEITIVDTVTYEGFTRGEEHTIKGVLMDKETGLPVMVDGKEVTAETTFTPDKPSGEAEVVFTFDATGLAGTDVVVFETAYDAKGEFLAEHKDINDEGQTIEIVEPEIGTTALDINTKDHITFSNGKVTVVDTVEYTDLVPGKEVTLEGKMMSKENEEPMKDKSGKEITAKTTFTPQESDGTVDVTFEFDASTLAGQTGVVFEELYFGTEVVATHEDIDDEDQTLYFPEIGTLAFIDKPENKTITQDRVTITDRVTYNNLIPGKQYSLTAALLDKKTGDTIATGGIRFTPEKANGSIDVPIKVNAGQFNGHDLVVYESLWYNSHKIASHDDFNDPDQTVKVDIPVVKTGSTVPPYIYLALAMLALSGAGFAGYRIRKMRKAE